jgi:hypothetical protein
MPRGDGTGPMGFGPMTGRAAGYCAGYGAPGYANPMWGRGRGGGRGRGRGWGFRHWYHATGLPGWARGHWPGPWGPAAFPVPPAWPAAGPDDGDDVEALREQAGYLRDALENVEKRLSELEAAGDE